MDDLINPEQDDHAGRGLRAQGSSVLHQRPEEVALQQRVLTKQELYAEAFEQVNAMLLELQTSAPQE